jgi:AAA family ATP:ADP antiporter
MSVTTDASFGKLRAFLWPIHRHEARKFVPMFLMLFFICFNYSILHNMKDALVITASSSGAAVIPFIKVWALLPTAILLTYVFTKLTSRYGQERVFYIMMSLFLFCYAVFAFIIYPMRESLHPHEAADALEKMLPIGFKGLITMLRNWTFTGFYVMCELWSNIVMTVMFWGFANEVTKIQEAGRFYSILGVGSNLASIVAGSLGNLLTFKEYHPILPFGNDAWEQSFTLLVTMVILSGIVTMSLFAWVNKHARHDPAFGELYKVEARVKGPKKKLSIRDSFAYLSGSKYLICIAILVVCYNMVIHFNEVVWKDQLRLLCPSPNDYNTYMNNLTTIIGIVSLFPALFMSRLIARCGWTFTAMITPIIMLITSAGFFSFLVFKENLSGLSMSLLGTSPLVIVVFFGFIQNCLSRASKYSVFDATKEMAFIPLPHESKLKGKAAIDGVGSRLGKSGSSMIYQGLLFFFSSLAASVPYVAFIIMGVITIWLIAVRSLGRQFNELVGTKETAVADSNKAEALAT